MKYLQLKLCLILSLVEILKRSERLNEFPVNPQAFMSAVRHEISRALQDLMIKGIKYEKTSDYWDMDLIEGELISYLDKLYEVQNKEKSLFDCIEYASEVEKKFAKDLDNNEHVKLFVKLPRRFKIDTPIGRYNPDWAFVCDEKLYFVAETKSTIDEEKLRKSENQKIECAEKHFDAIGVDYKKVTKLSDVYINTIHSSNNQCFKSQVSFYHE